MLAPLEPLYAGPARTTTLAQLAPRRELPGGLLLHLPPSLVFSERIQAARTVSCFRSGQILLNRATRLRDEHMCRCLSVHTEVGGPPRPLVPCMCCDLSIN